MAAMERWPRAHPHLHRWAARWVLGVGKGRGGSRHAAHPHVGLEHIHIFTDRFDEHNGYRLADGTRHLRGALHQRPPPLAGGVGRVEDACQRAVAARVSAQCGGGGAQAPSGAGAGGCMLRPSGLTNIAASGRKPVEELVQCGHGDLVPQPAGSLVLLAEEFRTRMGRQVRAVVGAGSSPAVLASVEDLSAGAGPGQKGEELVRDE
eukprot:scaffold2957_cov226-Isochrysis_galbana.AAC.1